LNWIELNLNTCSYSLHLDIATRGTVLLHLRKGFFVSQFLVRCCFLTHISIFCISNVSNTYSLRSFDTWHSFRLSLDAFIYFQFLRMFCFRMTQPRHFYLKHKNMVLNDVFWNLMMLWPRFWAIWLRIWGITARPMVRDYYIHV